MILTFIVLPHLNDTSFTVQYSGRKIPFYKIPIYLYLTIVSTTLVSKGSIYDKV